MSEVADSYIDVWGKPKEIEPETREALLKALGPARPIRKKLKIEDTRCHQPEVLEEGGRIWGFMVQLYGVRSARNWGIGDFGDLANLIQLAARLGASLIGVNPLHAAQVSPYSPSSRHALNTIYLDIEAIPEFARCAPAQRLVASTMFKNQIQKLRESALVDYDGTRKAKKRVLELLYACFRKSRERRAEFSAFQKTLA